MLWASEPRFALQAGLRDLGLKDLAFRYLGFRDLRGLGESFSFLTSLRNLDSRLNPTFKNLLSNPPLCRKADLGQNVPKP